MNARPAVHKLVLTLVATLAVSAMGTGCSEQQTPTTTTQAPEQTPAVEPAPMEQPAAPQTPAVTETPAPTEQPAMTETPAPAPATGDKAVFDAFAKKAGVPAAYVPQVSQEPKVDGVMDDVYKKATPLTLKFLTGGEGKPAAKTTVYTISTAKTWYIFYNLESPDMDALMADVREHDGPVWNDDSIEIFVDPTNKRQIDTYMHFGVNALGTTMEAKGPKGDEDYSWNPKMTAKAKTGPKAWTLEIAIPFSELVKDPAKMDKVWAVNFNRMAYLIEGAEDTAWSPTGGTDSHIPAKFGALWFQAGKVNNVK